MDAGILLPTREGALTGRTAGHAAIVTDSGLPDVARPLDQASEIAAALAAFAARSAGLRLVPGAVARSAAGTAIEWVGSIGVGAQARRFALVELVTALPERSEWRLLFNTFGL